MDVINSLVRHSSATQVTIPLAAGVSLAAALLPWLGASIHASFSTIPPSLEPATLYQRHISSLQYVLTHFF